jgi:hypothetical protein
MIFALTLALLCSAFAQNCAIWGCYKMDPPVIDKLGWTGLCFASNYSQFHYNSSFRKVDLGEQHS